MRNEYRESRETSGVMRAPEATIGIFVLMMEVAREGQHRAWMDRDHDEVTTKVLSSE